ncbi:unnamed protein product, partial [Allacma fusca]
AVSSTESEYIALASAARESVWLKRLLEELSYPQTAPTTIHVDNQSAIRLAKNPEMHQRTEHIDVKYHYSRNLVEDEQIDITYIPTENQLADCFTKPLAKGKFEQNVKEIGMKRTNSESEPISPRKLPRTTLTSMMWTMMTVLFMCLITTNVTTEKATPLLWRKSPIPVITGYHQVNLMVSFLSPCELISTASIHTSLTPEAMKRCNRIYQDMFLGELQKMCPRKKWTEVLQGETNQALDRNKRFLVTLTAILICVVIASAGLGIAGTTMAATNRNRITDLKTLQEAQQKTLNELEQKIKSNTENIRRLQNSFNEAITSIQGLQHDHDELKGKLISTNYDPYLTT